MSLKFNPEFIDAHMSGWFNNDSGELLEGFQITPEDTVLDVGCGDGAFLDFCAKQGAELMFADVDEAKITQAYERLKTLTDRTLVPMVSDANPLPVDNASASRIIAMEVMEHVENPKQFLSEIVRVGKPGAQYLITVPDPVAEHIQKDLAPESYFLPPNHVRIIERDEFSSLIEGAGLIIEKRTSYGFYRSIWWMLFWACELEDTSESHPLLESWKETWGHLLKTDQGPKIKKVLDNFMPKSQAVIARKQ